jgi:hypothetical protein
VGMANGRLALPGCGSPGSSVGGDGGQAGSGMAAIRAKTATMSWTQGQVAGIRRWRIGDRFSVSTDRPWIATWHAQPVRHPTSERYRRPHKPAGARRRALGLIRGRLVARVMAAISDLDSKVAIVVGCCHVGLSVALRRVSP